MNLLLAFLLFIIPAISYSQINNYEKFGEKHLFLADSWKLGFHAIRKLSNGSFERRAFIY